MLLVTGGAGFIGANFVVSTLAATGEAIVNLDKLTYAGDLENLQALASEARHQFVRGDICNRGLVRELLARHRPRAIVHFAAESHVDRSIEGPAAFIETNVVGSFSLLEESRVWWSALPADERARFRFLHVSTDEVYGSLGPADPAFSETTPFAPNSPYAASKAAAEHMVRAAVHTHGLDAVITRCSNNYGPYQFPEKLIPLFIANAMEGRPVPVYGDGMQVRDWIYVDDHCRAVLDVLERGRAGDVYCVGARTERANLEVIRGLLHAVGAPESLITYVTDRPGHDRRYAIDPSKIERELGWAPRESFETGIAKTVAWYRNNREWVARTRSGAYREYYERNSGWRSS